jgi:tetratricopeptide (TPR) repeat protein
MDYEASLNQALDHLADDEERKARVLLEAGIKHVKAHLTGGDDDLERHYYWGRFLTALEEYEQALLKFEKALRIDPEHEGSLWETASILLHDLDKPELAQTLLKEKLVPLHPENTLYAETLREAEFLVRVMKRPPKDPRGKEGGDDADLAGEDEEGGDGNSRPGPEFGPFDPR